MTGLDVIDGGGDTAVVTINGQQFAFGALKCGRLPEFARAVRPIVDKINALITGAESLDAGYFVDLIADNGDSLLSAISIATGIPRKAIDEAELSTLAEVLPLVLAINKDFLIRRLAPALQAAAKQIARPAAPGTGPTP